MPNSDGARWRLLAHTVVDRTALEAYLPAVHKFLDYLDRQVAGGYRVHAYADLDEALLAYLTRECYLEDRHAQLGSLLVNGLVYTVSEASHSLPLSWRALTGWQKGTAAEEGQPVGMESLVCMEEWLR